MFLYLSVLTNIIIDVYFKQTTCVFVILQGDNEGFTYLNKSAVVFRYTKLNDLKEFFFKSDLINKIFCKGFIIQSNERVEILHYLEESILPKLKYQYDERSYLLLPCKNDSSKEKNLNITRINKREFLNILDIYYHQDKEIYHLYNYKNRSLIDIWSHKKGFLYNNNLYPSDNNIHEMAIRITGFNYLPYVIFGAQESFGIDVNLLKLFSTLYNGSLIILQENEENWQHLYELVSENQADVALGGFQLTRSYNDLDLSTVYYYTKFKALVPKPKLLKGTLAPFRALSPGSWTLLTLLFIVFIIIITSLIIYQSPSYQKPNIIKSWLAIYGMFFTQSPAIPIILLTFKSIFVWVHLTSFVVASIYNSGAASILIVPSYEHGINSIDELIESDLKLGTFNIEEFSLPLSSSEFVRDNKVMSHFFEATHKEINDLVQNRSAGVIIEETKYFNYASECIDSKTLHHLQLMRESISSVHLAFICRKNWELLKHFNKFIMQVVETGLIYPWEQEAIYLRSTLNYQRSIRFSSIQSLEITRLKLNHVYGAFITLLIGLFCSFIIFLLELSYFDVLRLILKVQIKIKKWIYKIPFIN